MEEARSLIKENAPEELTQRFVSENIVDSKEITKADFNHILKQVSEDEEEEDNSSLGEKIITSNKKLMLDNYMTDGILRLSQDNNFFGD